MHKRIDGFTFIELMITVAIVAILGIIAFPHYKIFTYKALRTDAVFTLSQVNRAQMGYFAVYDEFLPAGCSDGEGTCTANAVDINQQLGIGLGEYTAHGYRFFLGYYSTWNCPTGGEIGKSCGFGAFLEKDLDHHPVSMEISYSFMNDQLYVFNNFQVNAGWPNDGTPMIYFNDLTNKLYDQ